MQCGGSLRAGRAGAVRESARLLGGALWEMQASPGEGLAQAMGQRPKGAWLVENGPTSGMEEGVIAGTWAAFGRTLQRAWLSPIAHKNLSGHLRRKGRNQLSPRLETPFPGSFRPRADGEIPPTRFPQRSRPLGRHRQISLGALPQSPPSATLLARPALRRRTTEQNDCPV